MRSKYIIFFIFCVVLNLHSQSTDIFTGGISGLGYGQASVSQSDAYSALNNQAGIISEKNWSFGLSATNLYGLTSLNALSIAGAKTINKKSAISLSVKYLGDVEYNQQTIGIAYARKLMKNWNLALQADLLSYQSQSFGSSYIATVEVGSIVKFSKKINIGIHIFNPFGQSVSDDYLIPAVFRLGANYLVSEKVNLLAEVNKDIISPVNLRFGLDYQPVEVLSLKAGFQTTGNPIFFGISYGFNNFKLHGASALHQSIGTSIGAGLSYSK